MRNLIYLFFLTTSLITLNSCNNKKKVEFLGHNKEILQNWGENIIIPAYKNYQSKVTALANDTQNFKQEKTEENFNKLKSSWLNAYKAFQKILIFNFKFAEKSYLIEMANTYPTNVESIERNINLISENKIDKIILIPTYADVQRVYQGFPALDYLLFEKNHTLEYYQSNMGDNACTYMVLLTQFLEENSKSVVEHWEKYLPTYIEDTDVSSTGAYAATINGFVKAYEKSIRAEKVGYAAGAIRAQNGKPAPQVIEAYYNGNISKKLLLIALKSSQDFFNGKYFDGTKEGKSLRQALLKLNQKALVSDINKQYDKIYKTIENTPLSLKETAVSNNQKMRELYDALQKNVAYYKTYMLATLSVPVGYVDSDGD